MVISGQPWPDGSPFKSVHIVFNAKQSPSSPPNSAEMPSDKPLPVESGQLEGGSLRKR